ncbi:hypothetical protein JHD48_02625 [Sulfurimonas sp. SAG-AH-194-I05]|nr:CheR family methyltransferase [Sulfurimonas sp. SAG-AH-194-I05]MDF1874625.1 hypothetical protein [Sulfurimonas sp. SAG-AH-194-I05]
MFDWLHRTKKEPILQEKQEHKKEKDFTNFSLVAKYLYDKSGITELDKRHLVASRLQSYAQKLDIYTTNEFLDRLKNDSQFYQEVLNIVTVNETFFLREIKELEWLIEYIKKANGIVKILSLPCSSGEEIYSILLLMQEHSISLDKVEITGYDINTYALSLAKKGIFDEHSLHKIEKTTCDKYFIPLENNTFQLNKIFCNRIHLQQRNIFEIREKNCFDIILSRNMFIYFDAQKREEATKVIIDLLVDGGIYIKGHADQIYKDPRLKNLHFGIYSKE